MFDDRKKNETLPACSSQNGRCYNKLLLSLSWEGRGTGWRRKPEQKARALERRNQNLGPGRGRPRGPGGRAGRGPLRRAARVGRARRDWRGGIRAAGRAARAGGALIRSWQLGTAGRREVKRRARSHDRGAAPGPGRPGPPPPAAPGKVGRGAAPAQWRPAAPPAGAGGAPGRVAGAGGPEASGRAGGGGVGEGGGEPAGARRGWRGPGGAGAPGAYPFQDRAPARAFEVHSEVCGAVFVGSAGRTWGARSGCWKRRPRRKPRPAGPGGRGPGRPRRGEAYLGSSADAGQPGRAAAASSPPGSPAPLPGRASPFPDAGSGPGALGPRRRADPGAGALPGAPARSGRATRAADPGECEGRGGGRPARLMCRAAL